MDEAKQAIYWSLRQLHLKPDEDFTYNEDSKVAYEGTLVDFALPPSEIAIDVVGIDKPKNPMTRAILEGQRIRVIYLDESDVLREPLYHVREALAGRGNQHGLV